MGELTKLKGIGPKTEKYFKSLGIDTRLDLLDYFPRDYEAYQFPKRLIELEVGEVATIDAIVVGKPSFFKRGRIGITSAILDDGTARIKAFWFNSPFMNKNLYPGMSAIFRGKVARVKNGVTISQAKVYKRENYELLKGSLNPVYPLTHGLTNYTIKKAIAELLTELNEKNMEIFEEYLPSDLLRERKLCDIQYAYNNIHFPKKYEDMLCARKRLVYNELFMYSLTLFLNKDKETRKGNIVLKSIAENKVYDVIKKLPYKLTSDQEKTIKDIINDFKSGKKLNRLIEGDVGSGKTIVAVLASLLMVDKKLQTAFMAPTELLAEQHYNTICKLVIDGVLSKELNVALLTGSTKTKEKKLILKELKNGEIDILVGTHALFSKDVVFNDLGLCVIDEQHRFGVEQRNALIEKSRSAGILAMSATPIPRTLAMLLYADMDISYLKEKPKNRLRIKNCVITKKDREKAYKAIKIEIDAGHQAYIVVASIEKNDDEDVGSFLCLENVNDYAKIIKEYFGKNVRVETLHGKMTTEKKEKIMSDFKDGNIDILVTTTVVEVGVDVPNATFMMVEDAGYFGLAELHQLRGRVGRGTAQSYALFVDTNPTEKSKERLSILNNSNDGFFIAEEDLRLRGAGDVFGVRQSGAIGFKLADMYTDYGTFQLAQVDAKEFIDKGNVIKPIIRSKIDEKLEKGYTI